MENRFVCIHGHFYQPPRENPWLEVVEVQDSAYPYRDWNERITAECYSPNTASRIKNNEGKIIDIVNNYSKISFNFGPTLLSWMQTCAVETYDSILKADELSKKNFSGHGSAIAQVYNHIIMPLANTRDKETQVIWGKADFIYRFKREPEGMWLAETAVDIETLEMLAKHGLKYTILAPRQAKRIKHFDSKDWQDVNKSNIDPKRAYLCKLPSGNSINLFFYDGPISQELAFGDLLKSGENLADRMISTFSNHTEPQLAHIATDGETYGHHSKHGDMALAYCLNYIESNDHANITIYGEFLEKFPPQYEVEIYENTSWSCIHGIDRWKNNCGCNSGRDDWTQEWREPLRNALDWLRDEILPIYEKEISMYVKDPWDARNEYISVILDRSKKSRDAFFDKVKKENVELKNDDKIKILKLLEVQRHALLMYTSCGWFFDEVSGIETVQVILYAGRAIQLIKEITGKDFEIEFAKLLEHAPSNISDVGNGSYAYWNYVKPSFVDFYRVAAHYAISTLFNSRDNQNQVFCYNVENDVIKKYDAGKSKLVIGKSKMESQITCETDKVSFAVVHLGDHNVNGGVRESISEDKFNQMQLELEDAFQKYNVADIILLLDKHFGMHNYSLWHLFKDESRNVFNKILESTLNDTEYSFRQIYKNYYPVMNAIKQSDLPLPNIIFTAVEFIINSDIKKILQNPASIDTTKLQQLTEEANKWQIKIDRETHSYIGSKRINSLIEKLQKDIMNLDLLNEIELSLIALKNINLDLDLWISQNILFYIHEEHFSSLKEKAEKGDAQAKHWIEKIKCIENLIDVRI